MSDKFENRIESLGKAELLAYIENLERNYENLNALYQQHLDSHKKVEEEEREAQIRSNEASTEFLIRFYLGGAVFWFYCYNWGDFDHYFSSAITGLIPAILIQFLVNPIRNLQKR